MPNYWWNVIPAIVKQQQQIASTGSTGHTGSWGTTDSGWTEAAQKVLSPSTPLTKDNGSNLIGSSTTTGTTKTGDTGTVAVAGGGGTVDTSIKTGGGNTGGGGTGGVPSPESVSDEELNAIYNPLFESFESQKNSLLAQQPEYLKSIESAGETQKGLFDTRLKEGTAELNTQEVATRDAEKSAIAQARKIFNELNQYNLARFGSGSSTGQAALELLGRSTSGTIGSATETAAKNVQTIKNNLMKLQDYVTNQKATIQKEVDSKVQEAKLWFTTKVNEINANRALAESEKAAKRYEALTQRYAYINDLKSAQYDYQQKLANWQTGQQTALEQALKESTEANPEEVTTDEFGNIIAGANSGAAALKGDTSGGTTTTGGGTSFTYGGKTYTKIGSKWYDDEGNLLSTGSTMSG